METVVLLLLVVVSGVLTIVLLGCLRTLADVRLQLRTGGRSSLLTTSNDLVAIGRQLPEQLRRELPWLEEDGLILFLSPECTLCWDAVSVLPKIRVENVVVGISRGDDEMARSVPDPFVVLPANIASDLIDLFQFEAMPFAIHQRDGFVVGTIHSEALTSVDEIERMLANSGVRLKEVAA